MFLLFTLVQIMRIPTELFLLLEVGGSGKI